MRSIRVLLAVIATAPVLAAPPENAASLLPDGSLHGAGMYRYWEAQVPLVAGDRIVDGTLLYDTIYITTDMGYAFAVTADSGLIRWGARVTEPDFRIYRPAVVLTPEGPGPVVFPATNHFAVHDRLKGRRIQRFVTDFPVGSPAIAVQDKLYVGSGNGRVYSLQVGYEADIEPFILWEVFADGPVTAAPVLYGDGLLAFASQSGDVFSCYALDKRLKWKFSTGGPIKADPFVDDTAVYVASQDRSVYKIDRDRGRPLWRHRMPQPLLDGPVVVAETVYQYCWQYGLAAIDAGTGRERWRRPRGRSFVAHTANGDVILTDDRRIEVVDHASGEVRHTIDASGVTGAVPNVRSDPAYLFGTEGRVICVRLDAVPYLRRQQVLSARQRLNAAPARRDADLEPLETAEGERAKPRHPLRSKYDRRPD